MNVKEMFDKICPYIESPVYSKIVQRNPSIEKKFDQLSQMLELSEISHDCERTAVEFLELIGEELKNLKKEKQAV